MLANNTLLRPTNPGIWLANLLGRFVSKQPEHPITHGTATYIKSGDVAIHQQTDLTFQRGKEAPEAFMWRVWSQADDGDTVEYRLRDGLVSAATITKKSALPISMRDGEELSEFVARVKQYKAMPRA